MFQPAGRAAATDEEPDSLLASEPRYRYLFDAAPDALFVFALGEEGIPGGLVEVNEEACRRLGYSRDELLQRNVSDIVAHPPAKIQEILRELVQTGTTTQQSEHRTRDGRLIPVEVCARLIEWEGRPYVMATARDVAKFRETARALRESEERLRYTLDAARVGSWDWNIATGEVTWSGNVEAIHDRLPGSFGGSVEAVLEEVYPPDRPQVEAAIRAALEGDGEFEVDYRILRSDGSLGWLHGQGRATFDDQGRPVRMAGVCMDVTERRQGDAITRLLAEAGSLLSNTLDIERTLEGVAKLLAPTLGDWCAIDLARDGRVLEHVAVVHADPEKVALARELRRHYPPDLAAPRGVANVIRTGEPELHAEVSDDLLRAAAQDEGHLRILRELGLRSAMVVPLTARGRTMGAITLVSAESQRRYNERDLAVVQELAARCALAVDNARLFGESQRELAERRQAEEKLREAREAADAANRAKSEFLANMSHEIRTPMTSILGYADVLGKHLEDPDDLQCVDTIRRNGKFLLDILNDILDLSRIEAGRLEIDRRRVRPDEVVADVCSLMDVRAREKRLPLSAAYEGLIPETIESDPTRLRQILVNLVGNAIKFTDGGSVRIRVRMLEHQRKLRFDVIDTGIGMTPEQQSRLFLPFTQGDPSVTRRYGGSGLGLTICRRLAEMLGGEIHAQSELNRGSTFTVTVDAGPLEGVPRVVPSKAFSPQPEEQHQTQRLECLVLVVDDRRDIRYLAQHFLEHAGARVKTAQNGREAIQAVLQARERGALFDLIVLDMQMPEMDGYEAAAVLRSRGVDTPIIALTAAAMQGDRERCLQAGCDDYTSKPIHGPHLVELAARYTQQVTRKELRQRREELLTAGGGECEEETAAAAASPNVRRVLLVDDNPDVRNLMSMLLEMSGHEVRVAGDGAAAISAAEEFRPEAVLLDLCLPDMNGYQVLSQLRQMPQLHSAVLIALSGRGEPEDRRQSEAAGFHHHLVKPASAEEVERLILEGREA